MNVIDILVFNQPSTGSWLVDIIAWLIKISSSIALGVVLFTVLLKLITLPFDFISRASMRKNSLKMEEMRPELEKLQKQYANDKNLYNQKVAALYKRNGYSMWGSCLPSIITLVIFIVAINAFTDYSKYANQTYIYNMTKSYNNVIYSGFEVDDNYIVRNAEGRIIVNLGKIQQVNDNVEIDLDASPDKVEIDLGTHKIFYEVDAGSVISVYTSNSIFKYVDSGANWHFELADNYKANLASEAIQKPENNNWKNSDGDDFDAFLLKNSQSEKTEDQLAMQFIKSIREDKSAESFRSENTKFLWVKNVWVTDSATKTPIESDWDNYKASFLADDGSVRIQKEQYNSLINKLEEEKTQPNGYFILVALTALSSFLTQFVTSKSQKAQMELQTVDGQGASTNKMMMWMMPIMMAVFAFMYTAAFSIYIVLSSVISLCTTLLINVIIDKKFKAQASQNKPAVVRGRVYTPPKEEPKKVEKKSWFAKKEEPEKPDFLTGKADKKKGK